MHVISVSGDCNQTRTDMQVLIINVYNEAFTVTLATTGEDKSL